MNFEDKDPSKVTPVELAERRSVPFHRRDRAVHVLGMTWLTNRVGASGETMMIESTRESGLEQLGAAARAWVFASPARLDDAEAARIQEIVRRFVDGWESHGVRLPAMCAMVENRFLVVAADERTDPSGCSIDKLFHLLQALAVETGTTLLESHRVYYRDRDGSIQSATRADFRDLASRGEVGPDTVVFDTSIDTLVDLLDGRWERPARESWHASLFG